MLASTRDPSIYIAQCLAHGALYVSVECNKKVGLGEVASLNSSVPMCGFSVYFGSLL